jgi:peptidoglycan/LPS O-acetylase OafA/YrhL
VTESITVPVVSPNSPKPRWDFIDGLRAIAALYVVFAHTFSEQTGGHFRNKWLEVPGSWAHFAVGVFIVLSGYCLTLPIARKNDEVGSLQEFFRRRVRRIVPPYYATLVISILLLATVSGQKTGGFSDLNLPLKTDTVVTHFLLIHDLPLHVQGGKINYPLWSIAVEFQIYLLMPLIAFSLRKAGNVCTLLWTMALGLLHFTFHGRLDSMVPWYVGLFTMGAISARYCMQAPSKISPRLSWVAWGLIALMILVSIKKGSTYMFWHQYAFDNIVGVVTAMLLCTSFMDASKKSSLLSKFLSWRPLVLIGVFSYSLYLIHAPLLHLFNLLFRQLHMGENITLLFLLMSIPAIVGLAYIFHLVFEKPFIHSRPVKAQQTTTL